MGTIFIALSVLFFAAALVSYQITGMKKLFLLIFSLHTISVLISFGILLSDFLTDNFANMYVYSHSAKNLPVYYKISALWAGQDGSLLLWMTLISIVSLLYFLIENEVSLFEIVIHLINFLFVALLLLTYSNPFTMNAVAAADGMGLNPVLSNFWMTVHPPVTFLGYTFALICFSSSIRRMLKEEYFYDHDQKVPVILVLLVLGLGIVFGAFWAYKTLGWGGFWGWDPIENASLVPWLLALIYVHSSILEKRYRQLIVHNNLMAAFIYISVIIAVFLTISGVLQNSSVHSFGQSGVTIPFLVYIAFLILLVIGVASRYNKYKPSIIQDDYDFISHLSYAIIAISFFAAFIFLSTVVPVVFSFFNKSFVVNSSLFPKAALLFAAAYIMSVFNYYYDNRSEDRIVLIFSGTIALATGIYFNNLLFYHYVVVYFSVMIFFYLLYKLLFHNRGSENKTALCSHIVVMMFIASAGLFNSQPAQTYDLSAGQIFSAGNKQIEFTSYNENSENILFQIDEERKIVPYYKWNESQITFPLILTDGLSDVYIEPERIVSAKEKATVFAVNDKEFLQWKDNNFVKLDDLIVTKKNNSMNIEAILLFKTGDVAEKILVSMNFSGNAMTDQPAEVPFTGQTVNLRKFSIDEKIVQIYIAPDIFTKYKSDVLELTVGRKLYVKVIWGAFFLLILLFFFLLVKTFTGYELY